MSDWKTVALGDVFEIARGGSPRPIDNFTTEDPAGVNWIMIGDASEGSKYITRTKKRIRQEGVKRSRMVYPGDFLLTNSMSYGRPYIMRTSGCIHDGWLVLSDKRGVVDQDYFYHLLGSKAVYAEFSRLAAGATVKNLNIELVKGLSIPLPPLPEQRRIAEVLDRAEGLRAKRYASLGQIDALIDAIFLDLFGDPARNQRGWPVLRFEEALSMPLRNGLSPSNAGNVSAKVLTLSAITGSAFNADAWKTSTFLATPPPEQAVDESDFLICRGNGNIRLVGKGYFPSRRMPDVTFPDTMIAARVSPERVERTFLQHVWNSTAVRRQVESLARTTNGTFKINQSMVSEIAFFVPPLSLQRDFERRIHAIHGVRAAQRASLAEMDALFASLQHQAFRGEL